MVAGAQQADVQFDRQVYQPGDQIDITALGTNLTDSAWVGIVPSAVAHGDEATNDANDVGYKHLKDKDRVFLVAPKEPGEYDVRLNDSDQNGKEVASRTFTVEADPNPVLEAKLVRNQESELDPNSTFEVEFEAPLSFPENAWIGVVPSGTPHGEEQVGDSSNMGYEHLSGRSRGTVRLTAPDKPGEYDVRMYDSDNGGQEVGSVPIVVGGE